MIERNAKRFLELPILVEGPKILSVRDDGGVYIGTETQPVTRIHKNAVIKQLPRGHLFINDDELCDAVVDHGVQTAKAFPELAQRSMQESIDHLKTGGVYVQVLDGYESDSANRTLKTIAKRLLGNPITTRQVIIATTSEKTENRHIVLPINIIRRSPERISSLYNPTLDKEPSERIQIATVIVFQKP